MSYSQTHAQSGSQTVLNINTGTPSTPTWTPVYEITDISESGKQNKTVSATNLQSAAEEFISTLLSPGTYSLTYNRYSADPGQTAVASAFSSKAITMFQIVLPKTAAQVSTGDTYAFSALVEQLDDISALKPDGIVQTKASLKVSGAVAFTAGS